MERRHYQWRCGCSERRIFQILAPGMLDNPDELFAGEDSLRLDCPRCGAHYRITREALEAYAAERDK
jgi:molecular chaperone Hsp33